MILAELYKGTEDGPALSVSPCLELTVWFLGSTCSRFSYLHLRKSMHQMATDPDNCPFWTLHPHPRCVRLHTPLSVSPKSPGWFYDCPVSETRGGVVRVGFPPTCHHTSLKQRNLHKGQTLRRCLHSLASLVPMGIWIFFLLEEKSMAIHKGKKRLGNSVFRISKLKIDLGRLQSTSVILKSIGENATCEGGLRSSRTLAGAHGN